VNGHEKVSHLDSPQSLPGSPRRCGLDDLRPDPGHGGLQHLRLLRSRKLTVVARENFAMAHTKRTVDADSKPKIFISYSRKDAAFADQLEEALKARDFHPLIDRSDIYVFEDWWQRIQSLIVQADTIISVLSPDYVSSHTCKKEVAFAASRKKRFAPIEYRPVDCKLIPRALERLNVEFFCADKQFEQCMDGLAAALQTDIDWIRKHTEFGMQAYNWAASGKPRGLLLRPPMLEEAEHWIALRPRTAPMPTVETQAFIAESRRATMQRSRFLTAGLTAGLVVALGLACLFSLQEVAAKNATERAEQALDTTEELANRLVLKLGKEVSLSPTLQREIFDQAIQSYNKVIMLNPKDYKAYNDRGNAFFDKGKLNGDAADYGQALADFSQAIALNSKYAIAFSNRCWAGVTVTEQLQQALSDCASALRIDPSEYRALDNRGFAYLKLGRVSDAIDSFDAALKVNPKFPTSLYGRGLAKMRNEDREGADIDMAEALFIKINVADDLARLGFKPDTFAPIPAMADCGGSGC